MKKIVTILLVIFIIGGLLVSCDSRRNYNDGYADGFSAGYDIGYRTAMEVSQLPTANAAESEATTAPSTPVLPVVSEPENGHIFEQTTLSAVAPFCVETSGSGGYYIVLDPLEFESSGSDYENIRAELMAKYSNIVFYVTAGSSAEISVPLGVYEIYYAVGDTWYGEEHLFGPDTVYNKCDDTFSFTYEGDAYSGWTLQLQPVFNGNLDTSVINAEDFPH